MIKADIGVEAFLHEGYEPWSCLLKHRHSDFLVQEVLNDGTICSFDGSVVETEPELPAEQPTEPLVVPPKLSDEKREELENFSAAKTDVKEVTVDVNEWTKEERRDLHVYIRALGGGLDSNTNKDGTTIIVVRPKAGKKRRRQQNEIREPFVHFTMTKSDHDTAFAVHLIGKFLRCKRLQTCGQKDRRAITAQRVSLPRFQAFQLYNLNSRLRGIRITDVVPAGEELSLGQLSGNRFSICLRDFQSNCGLDEIKVGTVVIVLNFQSRIRQWETDGFINYFGDQRFGSFEVSTAAIGAALLKGDYETAVKLILQPKGSQREGPLHDALKEYAKSGDAQAANRLLARGLRDTSIESYALKYLSMSPTDFHGAIMSIPRGSRSLYVHAYQSLIFNKVASRRAQTHGLEVLPNDEFADDADPAQPTISDVVLQLPCEEMRIQNPELNQWYLEAMAEDGITTQSFKSLRSGFAVSPSGAQRRFVERPQNVEYKLVEYVNPNAEIQAVPNYTSVNPHEVKEITDQWTEGKRRALIIAFTLPSGVYATMALRELLRTDLSKAAQKELSEKYIKAEEKPIKEDLPINPEE